jgi:hypothetical protein
VEIESLALQNERSDPVLSSSIRSVLENRFRVGINIHTRACVIVRTACIVIVAIPNPVSFEGYSGQLPAGISNEFGIFSWGSEKFASGWWILASGWGV